MFWGIIHLFLTKSAVHVDENQWAFGQIVAVILLAAPIVGVAQNLFSGKLHLLYILQQNIRGAFTVTWLSMLTSPFRRPRTSRRSFYSQ